MTRNVKRLCYLVLAGLLLIIFGPFLIGWSSFIVQSPSMDPAIKPGSIAIIRPVEVDTLIVKDVVMYEHEGDTILHRIEHIRTESGNYIFKMKGDANEFTDFHEISEKEVKGKLVCSIPLIGFVIQYMKNHFFLLLIIGGLIWVIMDLIRKRKSSERNL
ncbi:signal peptidase I [Bacillus kexueae]|uniref:signal peptidase I n=1 Tax=Aeribacillus kexueae TaxID=2078952 RepID=UPI001FAEB3AA